MSEQTRSSLASDIAAAWGAPLLQLNLDELRTQHEEEFRASLRKALTTATVALPQAVLLNERGL